MQGIVERAQIGIDFFLHVAGEKAEPFARFDRWAGEDDAINPARDQHGDGLGDGKIGFAGACGAEGKHHFMFGEQLDIAGLAGAARADSAFAGADGREIRQG